MPRDEAGGPVSRGLSRFHFSLLAFWRATSETRGPLHPLVTHSLAGKTLRASLLDVEAAGHPEMSQQLAAYRAGRKSTGTSTFPPRAVQIRSRSSTNVWDA